MSKHLQARRRQQKTPGDYFIRDHQQLVILLVTAAVFGSLLVYRILEKSQRSYTVNSHSGDRASIIGISLK